MAQHDYVISNGTGAAVRSDLNNALLAIVSNNSGATAPSPTYAYQLWADTTTNTLKLRNGANSSFITVGDLTAANLGLATVASPTFTGTATIPTLTVSSAANIPLGSAGSPTLYFTGDSNTGLYSPGADQVALSTGGTGRLFIDSSGRCGIGTSSPGKPLDVRVAGDANVASFSNGSRGIDVAATSTGALIGAYNTDNDIQIKTYGSANNSIILSTSNAERLRVDPSGRVGIGVTPSEKLHVSGKLLLNNGTDSYFDSASSNGLVITNPTAVRWEVNSSERARIDSSGRLLVGTSTASGSALLQVAGDAQVQSLNGGPIAGTRNRIINGDMRIDQRNAGASITPTDGQYTVDRWKAQVSQASKFTAQQSTDAPTGFVNSLLFTSSSAYSVAAGDYFNISQYIEGVNVSDLGWGTANAKTVTLSFWVKCSLTGTFGGSVCNSANNRSYPFSYTVSAANTWEYKTILISGDTTGTWATDNTSGPQIRWSLGTGSTRLGTAGAWSGSQLFSVTGETSLVGTNGATLRIAGCQFEAGSVATPFERRSYGQELLLCQRYYEYSGIDVSLFWSGYAVNANNYYFPVKFSVMKRALATVTISNPAANGFNNPVVDTQADIGFRARALCNSTINMGYFGGAWTASAEL